MNIHDHLEKLYRSPTVRAMDHHGELQNILRAKRDALHVPVVLESPFSGAPPEYVHACIRDSLLRGEAPIASHVLYTQALDDTVPEERAAGMSAGFAWRWLAHAPWSTRTSGSRAVCRTGSTTHVPSGRR